MIEYGALYYHSNNDHFTYPYCAFRYKENLFVSDALNNRVTIINTNTNTYEYINLPDWFPRWIQPLSKNMFLYVDSKKRTIGLISDNRIIIEKTVPLTNPLFISRTQKNTFLVGGKGENPLIEYTMDFKIIGKYLNNKFSIQSAHYINETNFLVCDIERHQVLVCTKDGDVEWSYGKENFPGELIGELSTPKYSCCSNNLIYIADGKNNRVVCVDWNKNVKFIYTGNEYEQKLWWPTCIDRYEQKILITDAGNNRIIEIDESLTNSKQWGEPQIRKFELDNPRGIEVEGDYFYLADTYNHRILKFNKKLEPEVFFGGIRGSKKNELFWPRAVRCRGNNLLLIADSRNSRIIIIDKMKNIHRIIYGFMLDNAFYNFGDPHDIDIYDDKILITDSLLNQVIEINDSGYCLWIYGEKGELKNPHHARKSADGNVLISDTENNRVIKVNYECEILYEISNTSDGKLREPRWCEEVGNNILITDSGNNRIILVDLNGNVLKVYSKTNSSVIKTIRTPRCTRIIGKNLLISDTYNNRIIVDEFFEGRDEL